MREPGSFFIIITKKKQVSVQDAMEEVRQGTDADSQERLHENDTHAGSC